VCAWVSIACDNGDASSKSESGSMLVSGIQPSHAYLTVSSSRLSHNSPWPHNQSKHHQSNSLPWATLLQVPLVVASVMRMQHHPVQYPERLRN